MNTSWRNISSLWDCPVRDNILGKGKNIFHKSRRDDMSIYQAEVYSLSFVYHNEEVISTFSPIYILSIRGYFIPHEVRFVKNKRLNEAV